MTKRVEGMNGHDSVEFLKCRGISFQKLQNNCEYSMFVSISSLQANFPTYSFDTKTSS